MIPELYTPAEAAMKLKLFNDGKPNASFIRKLINKGELECVKVSKNNILISEDALGEFVKEKTCREEIKAPTQPSEKTGAGGVSENLLAGKDIGSLAAAEASERLRMSLSKSSSEDVKDNVIQIRSR